MIRSITKPTLRPYIHTGTTSNPGLLNRRKHNIITGARRPLHRTRRPTQNTHGKGLLGKLKLQDNTHKPQPQTEASPAQNTLDNSCPLFLSRLIRRQNIFLLCFISALRRSCLSMQQLRVSRWEKSSSKRSTLAQSQNQG